MSFTPIPPIDPSAAAEGGDGSDPTKEVDGTAVLDADASDDLIDSADADALASVDPDDQD